MVCVCLVKTYLHYYSVTETAMQTGVSEYQLAYHDPYFSSPHEPRAATAIEDHAPAPRYLTYRHIVRHSPTLRSLFYFLCRVANNNNHCQHVHNLERLCHLLHRRHW